MAFEYAPAVVEPVAVPRTTHLPHGTRHDLTACGTAVGQGKDWCAGEEAPSCGRCQRRLRRAEVFADDIRLAYEVAHTEFLHGYLTRLLARTRGNKNHAAQVAGVSRATFYRWRQAQGETRG